MKVETFKDLKNRKAFAKMKFVYPPWKTNEQIERCAD